MPKNPHADFSPVLKGYSGQSPFKFWCQMTLPLTYDDSLSYYELLNKVVSYLNNTISDVANVEDNVASLLTSFTQLQDYVNTYFDELDIEQELKNILDKMALDGSLDALLNPLVVSAIGDWLEDNLTPTTPPVDSTLSIANAAADAKVTGDTITDIKTQLSDFNCINFFNRGQNITSTTVNWTWNDDGSCTVTGANTGSATKLNYIIGSADTPIMPYGMIPGKTYKVKYSSVNVMLRINLFNGSTNIGIVDTYEDIDIDIPVNTTGIVALLRVPVGTNVGTETVKPIMYSTESNSQLSERAIKNNVPPTRILANSDLNTYITPGQYFVLSAANAGTIANIPAISAGQLIVNALTQYNAGGLKTLLQTYITVGEPHVYLRYSNGTTFTDWRELAYITDIYKAVDDLVTYNVPTDRIPANSDLNSYITPGQYYVLTYNDANTIANIPEITAGQLLVNVLTQYNEGGLKTLLQTYITVTEPHIYLRYSNGTTFTNWRDLADVTNINDAVTDLVTLKPISKTALASGDDLNTYVTPGQYRISTTAIALSLKNKPATFDTTGILIVSNTHNENHVYQTIYTNGFTGVWTRHIRIDQNIFDEWKSLVDAGGSYNWQEPKFLIHSPREEKADMLSVFEEYLEQTITNTHWWATLAQDGVRNASSVLIYSLWDTLQQKYPEYIDAGEVIGYSLDPNGDNYQPVKAYYIHPRLTDGRDSAIPYNAWQTVYITAGTHGVESSPTWNLFAIFRRAFLTGTIYSDFLNGIKYRVIPCLSRWSYDHFKRYLAAAYNADGTQRVPDADLPLYDANRMCICSGSTPSYSTLQIPLYATEAKALTDYLENNGFGANGKDVYLDLHNCSYSLGYMTSDNLPIRYAFNGMMDTLAKDWLANATYSNGDRVDYYETSTTNHFALNGKILGQESIENSFAWFFEKAYSPYSSNILEVQASDSDVGNTSCNEYALAKGLDITYRWFKFICEHIKAS